MKNKFLEKVSEQIVDDKSRELITAELESHLLDKIDYYVDIGYSKEDAEKRATEEMGNPEDTAVPLNALHNNNYRDLLSFICCGVIVIMFLCTIWFRDAFIYSFELNTYRHSILCDFVSLAFLIAYVVMLIISRKKNIKIIPLFVAISFILQFGSILVGYDEYPVSSSVPANMFYFYQPAMYAIAKILTEGLHAYLQCIFLGVPADSDILTGFCFEVMPYILGLFFIIWSILLFVRISRIETITNYKKPKVSIHIIETCISVFLTVNLVVMLTATSYKAIDDLITGNSYLSSCQEMSEYVFNADLTKDLSEISDNLESLGYYQYYKDTNRVTYYDKGGEIELSSEPDITEDCISLSYHTGDIFVPFYLRLGDFTYDSDIYEDNIAYDESPKILADMESIRNIDVGTTLESIEQSGLLKYADHIKKTYYRGTDKLEYQIDLSIYLNRGENNSDSNHIHNNLHIKDGVVTESYSSKK